MKKTTAIILMLVLALSAGAAQITNPVKVSDAGEEMLGGYGRGYLIGPGFSKSPSTLGGFISSWR